LSMFQQMRMLTTEDHLVIIKIIMQHKNDQRFYQRMNSNDKFTTH
jgi:hypothetical protein